MDNELKYYNRHHEDVVFPSKMEVCGRCNGLGVHDNENFNGFTHSEFYEDPEFAEDYFAGAHDVTCTVCKGKNVVPAPDYDQASDEEIEDYEKHLQELYDMAMTDHYERMAGA